MAYVPSAASTDTVETRFNRRVRPHHALQERLHDVGVLSPHAVPGLWDAPAIPPAPAPAIAPADLPAVDSHTLSMLQSYAASASGNDYNDGALARELLALAGDDPLPGLARERRWIPLQRIALAGRFLNEAIADPLLPVESRSQHESVRFPLVKAALADATLFTAAMHPVCSLLHELMLKSMTSRLSGSVEARRRAELLRLVLVQFDLAPGFVRQAMLTAEPINETLILRFFGQQRQNAQQRRDMAINKARRRVARELELCTLGRGVPSRALRFLTTVWGPLLTNRLLQHGAAHARWTAGLILMEELLNQLDARDQSTPAPPAWQELTRAMRDDLTAEGVAADAITEAVAHLEAARQTPSDVMGNPPPRVTEESGGRTTRGPAPTVFSLPPIAPAQRTVPAVSPVC